MAHPKLQTVRERYAFCCGYCGVSEADVGGELTVDHFRPVSAGVDHSDENLVYACVRCNQYKGGLLPEATDVARERALIVHRQRRYLAVLLEARLEQALTENKALRERMARRELYIAYLEERLTERRESE